jgi:hypothetical protein
VPPPVHGPDVQRFGIRNLFGLEDPQPDVPCVPKTGDREDKEGSVMLTNEDKQWISETISHAIAASEERTAARIEHVETSLLTEFHKWASPMDARQRTHMAMLRAIDLEMESLADRVTKLEPPRPPA